MRSCLSDQSGIALALCCWLASKKIWPPTTANGFSLHPQQRWRPSIPPLNPPDRRCYVKAPSIAESSFVRRSNPSAALATACWRTDEPQHRPCVSEGVPAEQYSLAALAKPAASTKKTSRLVFIDFLLPLHPTSPSLPSPPFPFLPSSTCLTCLLNGTIHRSRGHHIDGQGEGSERRRRKNVNISLLDGG